MLISPKCQLNVSRMNIRALKNTRELLRLLRYREVEAAPRAILLSRPNERFRASERINKLRAVWKNPARFPAAKPKSRRGINFLN